MPVCKAEKFKLRHYPLVRVTGRTIDQAAWWHPKSENDPKNRSHAPGGWPDRAPFWLESGSSRAEESLPVVRSRFRAVHPDSIPARPSQPVA
jgi:hypothetical protein